MDEAGNLRRHRVQARLQPGHRRRDVGECGGRLGRRARRRNVLLWRRGFRFVVMIAQHAHEPSHDTRQRLEHLIRMTAAILNIRARVLVKLLGRTGQFPPTRK